ncbi:response regulator [Spirosoma pollinicola]|uniref:DNA-binding response regulator n=1 Tax=Spirosoma pollinicola TaxID=2057025 RepID=A0A2K8YU07_9BACT|nr:response regulator transcription factor [Spirosoma pollinicola]AUD01122.1 DNA-binding response regulator [Spirosoma pollinicola]
MPATVAIVDDHRLYRQALTNFIRHSVGYKVLLEAENGNDLLNQLLRADKTPDLALVDLHMPGMDGFETTARLRQLYPAIRVLIVTISDRKEDVVQAIRSGAHGYLVKGQPDDLLKAMYDVITMGYHFPISLTSAKGDGQRSSLEKRQKAEDQLTDQEMTFVRMACSELTYRQLADKLGISLFALEQYRESVFVKLKVRSRVGLVMEALRRGWITL